jgi:hypothetical protein
MPYYLEVQYNSPREIGCFQGANSLAGPWESAAEAARFAQSKCGLPWRVVDEGFEQNQIEYASGNLDQPPADPPECPECKTINCEHGDGAWWCNA